VILQFWQSRVPRCPKVLQDSSSVDVVPTPSILVDARIYTYRCKHRSPCCVPVRGPRAVKQTDRPPMPPTHHESATLTRVGQLIALRVAWPAAAARRRHTLAASKASFRRIHHDACKKFSYNFHCRYPREVSSKSRAKKTATREAATRQSTIREGITSPTMCHVNT
jgi:hypothetical protein